MSRHYHFGMGSIEHSWAANGDLLSAVRETRWYGVTTNTFEAAVEMVIGEYLSDGQPMTPEGVVVEDHWRKQLLTRGYLEDPDEAICFFEIVTCENERCPRDSGFERFGVKR
jgi:hypothetical protein